MSHIVESCPLTKLNGGLSRLHSADEDTVSWLTNYGSWHAYEKKITTSKIQTVQCWLSALCAVTDRGTTKPVCVLWLTGILRSLFVCCDWQGYYEACLCVVTDRDTTKPVCVLWLTGVLRSLFDVFYDEEIISEETFRRWQGSSDPAEQAGKGVAVKSVQQFFTWLDGTSASWWQQAERFRPCAVVTA